MLEIWPTRIAQNKQFHIVIIQASENLKLLSQETHEKSKVSDPDVLDIPGLTHHIRQYNMYKLIIFIRKNNLIK